MIDNYIQQIRQALKTQAAHHTWFPDDKERRRTQNIKLGKEIGVALGGYPDKDVTGFIQSTYGIFIVANSFDGTGVVIDMKDWRNAVISGVNRVKPIEGANAN